MKRAADDYDLSEPQWETLTAAATHDTITTRDYEHHPSVVKVLKRYYLIEYVAPKVYRITGEGRRIWQTTDETRIRARR